MNPRFFMGRDRGARFEGPFGRGEHGCGRGPQFGGMPNMGMGRGMGRGMGFGPGEGWGGRMRRGAMRYILMDTLKDGPKHGYEIIKALEERSGGEYIPSPGTIYPTLQFLEDSGLVEAEQQGDRRVFRLTEAGAEELATRAKEVEAFWSKVESPRTSSKGQVEVGFLADELASLQRTVWSGLRAAMEDNDLDRVRRVRELIEQCRNEVRKAITEE